MSVQESARLIKAATARQARPGPAFNYDDLRRQGDDLVLQARRQAEQLLSKATSESEEICRRAYDDGFGAGQQAGLAAVRDQLEVRAAELAEQRLCAQLDVLRPAIEAATESLALERDRWMTMWEHAAIRLSAAIAGRIVDRELAARPELAQGMIREALELAAGMPEVRLRMHPETIASLAGCGDRLFESLRRVCDATIVPDPAVSQGGCIVESRQGTIDARLETQLERITQELLSAS